MASPCGVTTKSGARRGSASVPTAALAGVVAASATPAPPRAAACAAPADEAAWAMAGRAAAASSAWAAARISAPPPPGTTGSTVVVCRVGVDYHVAPRSRLSGSAVCRPGPSSRVPAGVAYGALIVRVPPSSAAIVVFVLTVAWPMAVRRSSYRWRRRDPSLPCPPSPQRDPLTLRPQPGSVHSQQAA